MELLCVWNYFVIEGYWRIDTLFFSVEILIAKMCLHWCIATAWSIFINILIFISKLLFTISLKCSNIFCKLLWSNSRQIYASVQIRYPLLCNHLQTKMSLILRGFFLFLKNEKKPIDESGVPNLAMNMELFLTVFACLD